MNRKIFFTILCILFIISCSPPKKSLQEIYKQTAKYIVIDSGPYNAWNGGPEWVYYCDFYEYKDNHYILKNNNGDMVADFTKGNDHRIEIKLNMENK